MGDRCRYCDEKYSEVDPVHVCSKGPFAPKLMLTPAVLQERPYREHAAHIDGLKEALEIASLIGGTEAARIWQNLIIAAIRSRIEELEKGR